MNKKLAFFLLLLAGLGINLEARRGGRHRGGRGFRGGGRRFAHRGHFRGGRRFRRGFGHRGFGRRRFGFGLGYGYPYGYGYGLGYGYPYGYGYGLGYGYPYGYGFGLGLGYGGYGGYDTYSPRSNYRRFQDNADENYWVIKNSTGQDITVKNRHGGPKVRIAAGETKELRHPYSFGFKIRDAQGKEIGQGKSEDHFIEISMSGWSGRVDIKTWN